MYFLFCQLIPRILFSGFKLTKLWEFVSPKNMRPICTPTACGGSYEGNFIACKSIFVLCINNALSEKNTSFLVYFVCSTEPVVRIVSFVAYIVFPRGVVEGVLFLQKFQLQLSHGLCFVKNIASENGFFQLNTLTIELTPPT